MPKTIDTREAPASRIAYVTRICAAPGESRPARTNGHALPRCRPRAGASAAAATTATASAGTTVAIVASLASGSRCNAARSATLIPPKSSAERSARPTAVT